MTDVPVSADFENGFSDAPKEVAANVLRAAETGLAGASVEDYSGSGISDFNHAVERIAACSEAISQLSFPFTLTARAENLLRGVDDLDDTIRRLQAFEAAGANVLYAPALKNLNQVRQVVQAVSAPVNVLSSFMPDVVLNQYAELGVRRISVGGALANHAIASTIAAASEMIHAGGFSWMKNVAPGNRVKELLGTKPQ